MVPRRVRSVEELSPDREPLHDADGIANLLAENATGSRLHHGMGIGGQRRTPKPRVKVLTAIDAIVGYRAQPPLPRAVTHDILDTAVGIFDAQTEEKRSADHSWL